MEVWLKVDHLSTQVIIVLYYDYDDFAHFGSVRMRYDLAYHFRSKAKFKLVNRELDVVDGRNKRRYFGMIFFRSVNFHFSHFIVMAKMVLFDGRRSIIHLGMSSDGSLRLASTNCLGMVKLWDIWDDGNMYATLTSPMGRTSFVYGDDLRVSSALLSSMQNPSITDCRLIN